MSLELDLQLRQQLKLNPQLQQSLKLLQLSQLELTQEIQLQLNSNPLLSCDSLDHEPLTQSSLAETSSPENNITAELQAKNVTIDDSERLWELVSDQYDLKERLEFQLQMHSLSRLDLEIGYYIIENLDQQGFLRSNPQEICAQIARDTEDEVEVDEVTAMIHLIQTLEPMGCASQDLKEFLLLQVTKDEQMPSLLKANVSSLLHEHFQLLVSHNYQKLQTKLKLSESELQQTIVSIKSLKQRPNDNKTEVINSYITPDIKVSKEVNGWQAQVTQTQLPKVGLNQSYLKMLKSSLKDQDKKYLQDKLQQAQSFIQSLKARQDTLQRVADYLIKYQRAFFESGESALKPLKLNDVAEHLELHESTISRATSNKYCQAPEGTFRLKKLFSNAIKTNQGGEWSQTAVKNKIQQLIKAEPSRKPLSDNSIVKLLSRDGIEIARRTVAKYRDALQIPSASKRKQLSSFPTS